MDTVRSAHPREQARHVTFDGHRLRLIITEGIGLVRSGERGEYRECGGAADLDAGTLTIYGATEAERVRNAFFAGRDLAEDAARRKGGRHA